MSQLLSSASPSSVPIRAWIDGVPVEAAAIQQARQVAQLPIVGPHVALMPDVHVGRGATVGAVIPTTGAVIPSAVGVDIGCGMIAARTSLSADQLPDTLRKIRLSIEAAVPHGRTHSGGKKDRGAHRKLPRTIAEAWATNLAPRFSTIVDKHPRIRQSNNARHLGTLGTGNHFIELCLDEVDRVWVMLHSGSRGVGNRIGSYFIRLAKKDMEQVIGSLPSEDLAYLREGTQHYADYLEAVGWAQDFARHNRELMMAATLNALKESSDLPSFSVSEEAVNCHHNYVREETHFGRSMLVTRKGAVSARQGELGIIPGSMGARSYIVSGLGNPDSFHSCSHGAGRVMSRSAAKKRFNVNDHRRATLGVECRKDAGVLDEIPMAYKDIDAVIAAQSDLVQVVHTLKQVVCVKG